MPTIASSLQAPSEHASAGPVESASATEATVDVTAASASERAGRAAAAERSSTASSAVSSDGARRQTTPARAG